jgi:hypothetical protein
VRPELTNATPTSEQKYHNLRTVTPISTRKAVRP